MQGLPCAAIIRRCKMSLTAENITKDYIRAGKGTNRFTAVKETDFTL